MPDWVGHSLMSVLISSSVQGLTSLLVSPHFRLHAAVKSGPLASGCRARRHHPLRKVAGIVPARQLGSTELIPHAGKRWMLPVLGKIANLVPQKIQLANVPR